MSDPEIHTAPLIRAGSQETAVNVGAPAAGSSSRAYKIAGFTLLACLLVAGQALTAYYLLTQRSDIKSLEEQGKGLKDELRKGRVASVQMQMHRPMDVMTKLIDDTVDEGPSTEAPKQGSEEATKCQLEEAGRKTPMMQLPDFRPRCDERGLYQPQQCWMSSQCWCVDTTSGEPIPNTMVIGPAQCGKHAASVGDGNKMMALADAMQLLDE